MFPFRRLVRLAELRWRYSTPPSHGSLCEQDSGPPPSQMEIGADRREYTNCNTKKLKRRPFLGNGYILLCMRRQVQMFLAYVLYLKNRSRLMSSPCSVPMCASPLSLLGNGWVNTFPLPRIHIIKVLLGASFSTRCSSHQRKVGD
jgi:hypothetical protein